MTFIIYFVLYNLSLLLFIFLELDSLSCLSIVYISPQKTKMQTNVFPSCHSFLLLPKSLKYNWKVEAQTWNMEKNSPTTMLITRAKMSPESTKIAARFSAECVLRQLMQGSRHGPHLTSHKLALHQAQCLVSYLKFLFF